jgi:hypothetical protein
MLYVILYFKLRNLVISQFGVKKFCFGHLKKTRLNALLITNKNAKIKAH